MRDVLPQHQSQVTLIHDDQMVETSAVEPFETVQQLRLALLAFKDHYNQKWLVERHGHRTPAAVRQALSPSTGAAV